VRDAHGKMAVAHQYTRGGLSEAVMDRDVAIRIDGMLTGASGNLNGIAYYMKNNLSDEEFRELVRSIGKSMATLMEISTRLFQASLTSCQRN
jgi:hypothetical protein